MTERELICSDCTRPISAEQWRLMGCCVDCERALRASWAKMDREYYERGGEVNY